MPSEPPYDARVPPATSDTYHVVRTAQRRNKTHTKGDSYTCTDRNYGWGIMGLRTATLVCCIDGLIGYSRGCIGSVGMFTRNNWSQESLPFALQHQFPISTPGHGRTKYAAVEAA
ncbi:hypothetical protein N7537_000243 [Penicillium hordei]|uniref:Uncharacterized protein n=1 Tax=Penicillium hordei TaxID=40994 RepID=A0AAD6EEF9_9EURO|nr:uncharacterized protein N7537_000243 [Penicillium hordei]KAJ5615129.1 hypothetical protein N7537_000243 [Penicillium hordei]